MNKLTKHYLIKREKLNETYYFQSLLQEGHRLKLLTDAEYENLQLQSIQLLTRQTARYTGGDSSSVKIETAQSIMQSIFYTIGVCLKSFPDTEMSITALKQQPLLELYRRGKELTIIQADNAKHLLSAVQNNRIVTDNCAYNDTLQEGIPSFFSAYDVEFAAHETPASIDYPLSNDKMDLAGCEYIYNYLQKLFLENQFCSCFPTDDINNLLRGYDYNSQDLLINIFGLVLTNAVGSVLADKNKVQLNIDPLEKTHLFQKLTNLPKPSLDLLLHEDLSRLCQEFKILDGPLKEHIAAALLDLSLRINNALEKNQLEFLFISFKANKPQPIMQFEDGRKMDDELFRSIANEIRECRYVSDKIAIIRREIHSLTDLVDILEGYCLFDEEFDEIFQSLGEMELALLYKKLPTHVVDRDFHFTENEKEWQNRLNRYLKELDATRGEIVRGLADIAITELQKCN